MATDGLRTWLVAWERDPGARTRLALARSSDGGRAWQVSTWPRIPAEGQGHGEPVLRFGNGTWLMAWSSDDPMADRVDGTLGSDRDLLFSRSTDGGLGWSRTAALNANAGFDWGDDGAPRLATDGAGTWLAVWRSVDSLGNTVGGDSDLFFSRSVDDGVSWSAPRPLVESFTRDRGFDVEPSLAYADGVWVVAWSSDEGLGDDVARDRDVLYTRSTDAGRTWTAPRRIASNGAEDDRGDYDPVVVSDGRGTWLCVYSSADTQRGSLGWDRDLMIVRSTDGGDSWSGPRALDVRASGDAGDDGRPTLAVDSSGRWIVAWESWDTLGGTLGGDADVLTMHSADGGLTWSPALPVEPAAASDRGADRAPALAADGAGRWLLVWSSTDPRGDLYGIDGDVLVTAAEWDVRPRPRPDAGPRGLR